MTTEVERALALTDKAEYAIAFHARVFETDLTQRPVQQVDGMSVSVSGRIFSWNGN
jgi:hypothetical protein